MRIWKGIDEEHNGNVGRMTLFIESANPDLNIVESVLQYHTDVKALYFGAGEVDVLGFDFITKLTALKKSYNVLFLLECSYENAVKYDIRSYFDFVIMRIKMDSIFGNEQLKLRTKERIYIKNVVEFESNSLSTLNDGQYINDIELYNDRR